MPDCPGVQRQRQYWPTLPWRPRSLSSIPRAGSRLEIGAGTVVVADARVPLRVQRQRGVRAHTRWHPRSVTKVAAWAVGTVNAATQSAARARSGGGRKAGMDRPPDGKGAGRRGRPRFGAGHQESGPATRRGHSRLRAALRHHGPPGPPTTATTRRHRRSAGRGTSGRRRRPRGACSHPSRPSAPRPAPRQEALPQRPHVPAGDVEQLAWPARRPASEQARRGPPREDSVDGIDGWAPPHHHPDLRRYR